MSDGCSTMLGRRERLAFAVQRESLFTFYLCPSLPPIRRLMVVVFRCLSSGINGYEMNEWRL